MFGTVLVCLIGILFHTLTILPSHLNIVTADSSALITPTKIMTNNNNTFSSHSSNLSKVKVVTSFYPIYDFTKHVGGDRIDASVLIPIGAEPHDFDPTIQQILAAQSADIIVYNGAGMENAWIKKIKLRFAVDTSQGLQQLLNESTDQRSLDPHIWLDPILAIHQVEIIRDGLIKIDPNNANYYNHNAERFIGQLKALDASIRSQLSSSNCAKRDFIAFHQAFGYFAKRYGLNQHSIQGLSPEGEILSQRLVQVVQLSHELGINVIYSEDLIDPRSSQAIAQEIPNGKVVVLSPIEGIKPQEQGAGIGYLDKMNENIAALKVGLQCKK